MESWVLRAVDQVTRNSHCEDSLVELKSAWPKPAAAARQIAAHANAARGAQILWIIGVDEVSGVSGADANELADWFSAVRSHFNHVYPELQDINVRIGDHTVVALLFQTDRAPFLVKNPVFGTAGGGSVEWEVPWRESRKTRTANREDIIRLIGPLVRLPELEWLQCSVSVHVEKSAEEASHQKWYLYGSLYVVPSGPEPLVIPFHRCGVTVTLANGQVLDDWADFKLSPPHRMHFSRGPGISSSVDSMTVESSSSEVIITGPGRVEFKASTVSEQDPEPVAGNISVTLRLNAIGTNTHSVIEEMLQPTTHDKDFRAKWEFSRVAT
ncbi:MAG: hypothetical protein C3F08_00595 [Candidatus Methylomirabilota bacterium]|nr:MAG: hypothetical protein C3F08_00595 [candidate division NC10 bacterium]